MEHTVYIDLAQEAARAASALTLLPSVRMKHRSDETISLAAMDSVGGAVAAIPNYVAGSGRVVLRERPTSAVLLLAAPVDVEGEDAEARYKAAWTGATMDSQALRDLMGDSTEDVTVWCEFQWADPGVRRVAFQVSIAPAFHQPDDEAPDPAGDASDAWLDPRAPRMDKDYPLNDEQRRKLMENVGDWFRGRLSEDEDYMHIYTPAGVYVGSHMLQNLEMPDLT